jgi:hypothetical protein
MNEETTARRTRTRKKKQQIETQERSCLMSLRTNTVGKHRNVGLWSPCPAARLSCHLVRTDSPFHLIPDEHLAVSLLRAEPPLGLLLELLLGEEEMIRGEMPELIWRSGQLGPRCCQIGASRGVLSVVLRLEVELNVTMRLEMKLDGMEVRMRMMIAATMTARVMRDENVEWE